MPQIIELLTLKSKDIQTQRAVIDHFTDLLMTSESIDLPALVTGDNVLDMSHESCQTTIRYCLMAVYAADIASVPTSDGRRAHLERLRELAALYGLTYDKIVYLAKYETALLRALEKLNSDGPHNRRSL